MSWETVIGLETHVQLSTRTKLFSRASTTFGANPNTNVNLVDCGLPGVLPSINKEAFYKAIRLGMAINAQINQTSISNRYRKLFEKIMAKRSHLGKDQEKTDRAELPGGPQVLLEIIFVDLGCLRQ